MRSRVAQFDFYNIQASVSLTCPPHKATSANMKSVLATAITLLATTATASVVFSLSTEPNGQGIRKSWGVDRWKCHDLAQDGIDNEASWAFVDIGLANGCQLYE